MESQRLEAVNLSEPIKAHVEQPNLNFKIGYEHVKSIELLPAKLSMNVSSTTLVSDSYFESGDSISTPIRSSDDNLSSKAVLSSFQSLVSATKTELEPSSLTSIPKEEVIESKVPLLPQDVSQVTLDEVACAAALDDSLQSSQTNLNQASDNQGANSLRHGISRYAPYGTRFAALMKDGTYRMSHIAGDLANRARGKGGKGGRVDLALVTHKGEREQLDVALSFYENTSNKYAFGPRPGPSEVLNHLKDIGIDWDYRKGDNVKLLQRNASNFFKRMMEHARRLSHPLAENYAIPSAPANATMVAQIPISQVTVAPAIESDPAVRNAAAILASMVHAKVHPQDCEDFSMNDDDYEDVRDMNDDHFDYSHQSSTSRSIINEEFKLDEITRLTDWSRPKHRAGSFYYEVCRNTSESLVEERDYYKKAAENFDWSTVEDVTSAYKPNRVVVPSSSSPKKRSYQNVYDSDSEFEEWGNRVVNGKSNPTSLKKQKTNTAYGNEKNSQQITTPRQRQPPKAFVSNGSVPSTAPQAVIRKGREGLSAGVFLKGLSRHSPYGTRFCATMPSGEKRESYLAGDLADRVRTGPGGGELLLVLHPGEIDQLHSAWEFIVSHSDSFNVGAGQVLEFLRLVRKDANHRKPGTALLQKNAGNFFKRVQEYGKRKQSDPNYLSLTPKEQSELQESNQLPPSPSNELLTSTTSTLLPNDLEIMSVKQHSSFNMQGEKECSSELFPESEEVSILYKEDSQIIIDSITTSLV